VPPPPADLIRVLLADDHPLLHDALGHLLGPRFAILEAVATLPELDRVLLGSDQPVDLLLLDLVFRRESALPRLPRYLRRRPDLRVVVVSAYFGRATGEAIFGAGAHGGFSKYDHPRELVSIIETVLAGGRAASVSFLPTVSTPDGAGQDLGEQTLRVIELLASGLPYKQVASLLSVSEKTVEYHAAQARRRFKGGETPTSWQSLLLRIGGRTRGSPEGLGSD
jgi:DNA-binding NarL/FixJ family response regulator